LEKAFRDSGLPRGPIRITPPHAETDQVIYLSGEFEQPHPFSIPQGKPATLLDVIRGCGGFTEKADLTHVRVLRMMGNKGSAQEVDVKHLLEGTGIQADIRLIAGDVIKIPSIQSQ
jgi:protein involved in polysaccharide export with SLBB domain